MGLITCHFEVMRSIRGILDVFSCCDMKIPLIPISEITDSTYAAVVYCLQSLWKGMLNFQLKLLKINM